MIEHYRHYWLVPSRNFGYDLLDGYVESESNLHYARFVGFDPRGNRIWVLESSDVPIGAISISLDQGEELIQARLHA